MRRNRWFLAGIGLLLALGVTPGKAADPTSEADRAIDAQKVARGDAERFRFETGDRRAAPCVFRPKVLLQWSNPVAGSIHGSVFVWTERGRPAVIGSLYKWYSPNHHRAVELHALSPEVVQGTLQGRPVWTPKRPGVTFQAIPGAPAPASSAGARLRQMRALAKEFTAQETSRDDVVRNLRLLTQPLYRDESTDPNVLDGGLFAFVEGTDPEVVLLIEARKSASGFQWQYAAARMNSCTMRLDHKGREVWSVATIPWSQARDHAEPYSLFIFDPDPGQDGDDPAP